MNLKEILLRIFYPYKCPLCHEIIPIERAECGCQGDSVQKISDDFCISCGADKERCTCELNSEINLSHIAGVYYYGGKIKSQIALFKFRGKKHFADEFSACMGERVAAVYHDVNFDAVTFVPSSSRTMKERGYNQSELLAKGIAKRLFLPLEDTLQKIIETDYQHRLSAKERFTNLDKAIAIKDNADIKGKTILLCDDIKTTGTTLQKCCNALYEGGAKEIYCVVLAVSAVLEF